MAVAYVREVGYVLLGRGEGGNHDLDIMDLSRVPL